MPVSLQHSSSFSTVSNSKVKFQTSVGMGRNSLASSAQSIGGDSADSIMGNEKLNMQNLNSRLASYMEKVHSLEKTNQTLEQKIKEFYEKKSSITRTDLSKYYIIIEDLQKQIISKAAENKKVYIILDNANLAASDFKLKFESERNLHLIVEADVTRLRTLLGELEVENKGLESQKTGLEEELSFLKKGHEEDMHMLRNQKSNTVNVQIDCPPAVNLDKELEEMRVHYEALILNNRNQLEQWFKSKTETLNTEVFESHTEITSSQKALSELKKTYQTLEIKIKAVQTQVQTLQSELAQVGGRYGEQLSQLQVFIDRLQTELQQLSANLTDQATEYKLLLNIKMRLEQEIEEYRRLIGGELQKEEEIHLHQKRVKIITEELVDGVVVASSVKESMQDLKNK